MLDKSWQEKSYYPSIHLIARHLDDQEVKEKDKK